MKAIDARILVTVTKRCDSDTCMQKVNGLITHLDPKQAYWEAEVTSVGEKVSEVKVGDTILIYPEAGKEFLYDNKVYRTITTSEVIAVI